MASRSMDLNLNKQKFENNLLNLKIYNKAYYLK